MFVIISGSLGTFIGLAFFFYFISWVIGFMNKPYSPSDKQTIVVILIWGITCVYPCFKIFEEDHRIWGWNSSPDGLGLGWRCFALSLLLFGWLIPFAGFGLYNKKLLK